MIASQTTNDRGQVGIGTLIVFIALVLVAAVAAGVLINTSSILQTQAQDTGEQSISEVSDRMQIMTVVGEVAAQTFDEEAVDLAGEEDNAIERIKVEVKKSPGADNVDLQRATVNWVRPEGGSISLVHEDSETANNNQDEPNFSVESIRDEDGSAPVLTREDDRMHIILELYSDSNRDPDGDNTDEVIAGEDGVPTDTLCIDNNNASDIGTGNCDDLNEDGATDADDTANNYPLWAMYPGDTAELTVTTSSGAESISTLRVPESLAGIDGGAVTL